MCASKLCVCVWECECHSMDACLEVGGQPWELGIEKVIMHGGKRLHLPGHFLGPHTPDSRAARSWNKPIPLSLACLCRPVSPLSLKLNLKLGGQCVGRCLTTGSSKTTCVYVCPSVHTQSLQVNNSDLKGRKHKLKNNRLLFIANFKNELLTPVVSDNPRAIWIVVLSVCCLCNQPVVGTDKQAWLQHKCWLHWDH